MEMGGYKRSIFGDLKRRLKTMVEKDDPGNPSNHLDGIRGVYPALRGGTPRGPPPRGPPRPLRAAHSLGGGLGRSWGGLGVVVGGLGAVW